MDGQRVIKYHKRPHPIYQKLKDFKQGMDELFQTTPQQQQNIQELRKQMSSIGGDVFAKIDSHMQQMQKLKVAPRW